MAEERKKARTPEERVAVGAILLGRDRTLRRLRESARERSAEARERVRRDGGKKTAVLVALLIVGRKLADDFGSILARGRAEARASARTRLRAELTKLGVEERLPAAKRAAAADVAEAEIAGESLAAQWRSLAIADALRASRKALEGVEQGGPYRESAAVKAALGDSVVALEPRLARTAVTEVAKAYNDEHAASARALVERYPELADKVLREWCALVDACEKCWHHDGERVGLDEPYSGGDEPGSQHPRCACTETIVSAV